MRSQYYHLLQNALWLMFEDQRLSMFESRRTMLSSQRERSRYLASQISLTVQEKRWLAHCSQRYNRYFSLRQERYLNSCSLNFILCCWLWWLTCASSSFNAFISSQNSLLVRSSQAQQCRLTASMSLIFLMLLTLECEQLADSMFLSMLSLSFRAEKVALQVFLAQACRVLMSCSCWMYQRSRSTPYYRYFEYCYDSFSLLFFQSQYFWKYCSDCFLYFYSYFLKNTRSSQNLSQVSFIFSSKMTSFLSFKPSLNFSSFRTEISRQSWLFQSRNFFMRSEESSTLCLPLKLASQICLNSDSCLISASCWIFLTLICSISYFCLNSAASFSLFSCMSFRLLMVLRAQWQSCFRAAMLISWFLLSSEPASMMLFISLIQRCCCMAFCQLMCMISNRTDSTYSQPQGYPLVRSSIRSMKTFTSERLVGYMPCKEMLLFTNYRSYFNIFYLDTCALFFLTSLLSFCTK